MRKYSKFSRFLAMLLVMALVLPMVPGSVFAAVGDIADGDYVGDTGLSTNIDANTTISWPIKIYDFLNDGMFFEYANANDDTGDISDKEGGAYGGGTPAPHYSGAVAVVGNDYTVSWAYNEYAYYHTSYNSFYKSCYWYSGSKVEAKNFVAPRHLRLVQQKARDEVCLSNFYVDNSQYYDKAAIRYAVIAYRTHGIEDSTIQLKWVTSGSSSYSGSAQEFKASEDWTYVVYDMKTGGANTNWNSIGSNNLDEVWFTFPEMEKSASAPGVDFAGDYIDISHIAYFDTEFEAIEFGRDAVAFDKDPGEFLDAHVEYTEGKYMDVEKPTTDGNGMDFSVADNTKGGYAVSTYDTWTAPPTYRQYLGNTVGGVKVTEVDGGERSYVSVSNSNNTADRSILLWQYSGGGKLYYITLVYKTTGFTSNQKIGFYVRSSDGGGSNMATTLSGATKSTTLVRSEGEWTTVTYAVSDFNDGDYNSSTAYIEYGMYLPSCLTGSSNAGKSLDIAMIQLTTDYNAAVAYGQQAADYMNGKTEYVQGSYTTIQKKWNTGNNVAFSLLYANQGGGWTASDHTNGGTNSWANGYYSYQIGSTVTTDTSNAQNAQRTEAAGKGYPVSDSIFMLNDSSTGVSTPYDIKELDFGYTLFNTLDGGLYTAGLLESGLVTVTDKDGNIYRIPNYKKETVEYIAHLLQGSLCIGQTDGSGNYNYNFVKGTANGEQYGYDANGKAMDLASALRQQLNIILPSAGGNCTNGYAAIGDYSTTVAKKSSLIGSFKDVKGDIETFTDAAYYLLMNLYIDNSYNQAQDEYHYLMLSSATLSDGRTGYIFDAGFTTGTKDKTANTDEYRESSESAVVYDKDNGTISLNSAASKDQLFYQSQLTTSRFPFLPITDAEGVYASIPSAVLDANGDPIYYGETQSPYFLDDGRGVMGVTEEGLTFANRNFNYAMVANGEFVYHEEDSLFFQFEGDDDVYLFINGELVLDIGAAHSVTSVSMNVNDYVEWAEKVLANPNGYTAEEVARAEKLNLQEGGTYTFDFYYMERHGWGANCRIATNIRVTDPAMSVDKTAEQYGENIPYGGAVDKNGAIEYNFALTNTGNTKLFNMTFTDTSIGVTLDYTKGLTVDADKNGVCVMDATGGTLDVTDLSAYVYGYEYVGTGGDYNKNASGEYVQAEDGDGAYKFNDSTITFADQDALIAFLKTLEGEGMKTDDEDGSSGSTNDANPQQGSGLWVDGSLVIQGIYYRLTQSQIDDGVFNNTVYVTAQNKNGTETLQSQATHRVYVSSSTSYYQWAGHDLFLSAAKLLEDATTAAKNEGNELYEDKSFFDHVNGDTGKITMTLCDEDGNEKTYTELRAYSDGYLINYQTAGTYTFYVKMSLKSTSGLAGGTVTSSIVPVTVYVTGVEDSVFVLDYGLTTDSLDAGGELFKNDELLGASGENSAALMGISNSLPSYLSITNSTTDYNRIDFIRWALESNKSVTPVVSGGGVADGYFTMSMSIPETGKTITYNAITNTYSLTETGTVTVYANVPTSWNNAYLYYWYDSDTANAQVPAWPGTAMTKSADSGRYSLEIPDDVSHVILCTVDANGAVVQQTADLSLTPGVETTYTVNSDLSVTRSTAVKNVTVHATVPADWGSKVYLYYQEENSTEWQYKQMSLDSASDGSYSVVVPGNVAKVYIGDAADASSTKQTVELSVYASRETWINVNETAYESETTYTYPETVTVTATVPDGWTDVCLYYWDGGTNNTWPGQTMTKDAATGKYSLEIPGNMSNVIISGMVGENREQTADLSKRAGWGANIEVTKTDGNISSVITYDSASTTVVTAAVPADWTTVSMDCYNSAGEKIGDTVTMTAINGTFTATITDGTVAYVVVHNGSGGQTEKLEVSGTAMTVAVESLYSALASYSTDTHTIHAKVPGDWTNVSLYCWDSTGAYYKAWPGETMTLDADGWYSLDIPSDITNVIINTGSGGMQTVDLSVQAGVESWITVSGQTVTQSDGRDMYTAAVSEAGFTFTPTDFMDDLYSVWLAVTVHKVGTSPTKLGEEININNEVQMYKKVTVLPATVVYYEDCFPAIKYANSATNTENTNTFTKLGKQSVDQEQEYGQDLYYQTNSNTVSSAGTITTIAIDSKETVAYFTFTGTGFELISRTNAADSATITIEVYHAADVTDGVPNSGATAVKVIPVITEFDNGADGGAEVIYQVPVIRVNDLEKGAYTVLISGVPGYNFDEAGTQTGTRATNLYLDGLRIYQPLGSTNDNYTANENGATFAEIRDLIVSGTVAVTKFDGESLSVSTGTVTWTENRNGTDTPYDTDGEVVFEGNLVDSVEDYLILGPNNEVYMNGTFENAAIAFYVTESDADVHDLQIAVHAVDQYAFNGTGTEAMNAEILYGVRNADGTYAWKPLVTAVSGTEQYYTIPYTECPVVDGRYQVVIKVNSGMASFTNLKYNGLSVESIGGDATTLYYKNGVLYNAGSDGKIGDGDMMADPSNYPNMSELRQLMSVTLSAAPGETEPDEPDTDPSEPLIDPTEPATQPTEPGQADKDGSALLWIIVILALGAAAAAAVYFVQKKRRG